MSQTTCPKCRTRIILTPDQCGEWIDCPECAFAFPVPVYPEATTHPKRSVLVPLVILMAVVLMLLILGLGWFLLTQVHLDGRRFS
jgi:hypothetical protein